MASTLSFTTTDQKDKEGKVIDKIFNIKEVETIEHTKLISGTEVEAKISILEKQISILEDELNFLKSLK